jgi:hypothetical protein
VEPVPAAAEAAEEAGKGSGLEVQEGKHQAPEHCKAPWVKAKDLCGKEEEDAEAEADPDIAWALAWEA